MNIFRLILPLCCAALLAVLPACSDSESYADLLASEDKYVNNFLADQVVVLEMPADTIFEVGEDAPYYRIDEDGMLYMQVLNAGTKGNMAEYNETIYFRYTAYALASYADSTLPEGFGNNITLSPSWFRFGNSSITESTQWGSGVQWPLVYLPVDCKVNLVIKSQMGFTDEQNYVQPYLFTLTYQRPAI